MKKLAITIALCLAATTTLAEPRRLPGDVVDGRPGMVCNRSASLDLARLYTKNVDVGNAQMREYLHFGDCWRNPTQTDFVLVESEGLFILANGEAAEVWKAKWPFSSTKLVPNEGYILLQVDLGAA